MKRSIGPASSCQCLATALAAWRSLELRWRPKAAAGPERSEGTAASRRCKVIEKKLRESFEAHIWGSTLLQAALNGCVALRLETVRSQWKRAVAVVPKMV